MYSSAEPVDSRHVHQLCGMNITLTVTFKLYTPVYLTNAILNPILPGNCYMFEAMSRIYNVKCKLWHKETAFAACWRLLVCVPSPSGGRGLGKPDPGVKKA